MHKGLHRRTETKAIYKNNNKQKQTHQKNLKNSSSLSILTPFVLTFSKLYHRLTSGVNSFSSFFTPNIYFFLLFVTNCTSTVFVSRKEFYNLFYVFFDLSDFLLYFFTFILHKIPYFLFIGLCFVNFNHRIYCIFT